MTNPNSRIITHTFPFRLHNHAHAPLLPLLFLAAATPYAAAQMSTESSPSSNYPYTNFDPPTAIIILVLVCAFFFVAFFSIYLRHCINVTDAEPNSANSTAARLRRFPRGLDPKVIESFPIFHYSEIKDHKVGKGTLECAVCINEFEDDETLRLLPKCNHVFHSDCIDAWLASHSTCPVCRANLVPEEVNQSNESIDEHNFRTELSEVMQNENQISISISINVEEEEDDEETEIRKRVNFRSRIESEVKFQRSHSTGHSLVGLGESCERYTLRLPEEVRKQIMMSGRLKRTRSCIVVLPMEGTSRGRFDQVGRLDRWIFSITPPFFSKNNRSKAGSTET
ncbi:LOW QUALITY PROTEIN: E3 ubiquitin-protein ligase ATL6-like [Camellia sinensis]|uniref:LOW QUALITY PROTEIN: E3 ubiquitin-protein ligase ATL6-like n=1 Tax=Camellia sinensis TaxID=4442 RepID=UPI001036AEE3|nr:LOW QUALITY PROTEIN: E3 ubiquitin-protein ligase ATL6-like [Camellia sinensis]